MKVVILAGGLPSTISEENDKIPKPMVRVGERPLLWHIMKLYSFYGYDDFIICTGFKSEIIKDYFLNYYIYESDITVDLLCNQVTIHNNISEPWKVTIVDTGLNTSTADRILKVRQFIGGEDFVISYGDCISDINIQELAETHSENKKILTLSVARPTGRNTILPVDGHTFESGEFKCNAWVNACNIVASNLIFDIIQPNDRFEVETINRVISMEQATIYKHEGLWAPVETLRDKEYLEEIWRDLKYY